MPRSIAELEKFKATELRKMAADMMRENPSRVFRQYGIEQSPSWVHRNGTKDDLIRCISQWESQAVGSVTEKAPTKKISKRTPKAKNKDKVPTLEPVIESTVVSTVEPVEVVEAEVEPTVDRIQIEIEKTKYQKSEEAKARIAKRIYYATVKENDLMGLREYQKNLCTRNKFFLPEFAILVSNARTFIVDYSNETSDEKEAHAGTVQKNRVDIMKYLRVLVEKENDLFPPVQDRDFLKVFEDFEESIRGAFRDFGAKKYKTTLENNSKAEEDVRAIKVLPYLEWAMEQVSNLPNNSARWKEVAIAIMLLTGRRQSEVLATGVFTYVNESKVVFEGQLKRHVAELVEAEEIPVLGKKAREVCEAIAWLEEHNKRTLPAERNVNALQLAAKKSHDRCSRYIAEAMEKLADKCEITNGKDWEVKEGNKIVNKFKGHLNRQIYAQICSALFNDPNERKKRAFISRILLENRAAALSYDRDVEVVDISDLKDLCGALV